jgi:N-methylhydantoinase A
MLNHGFAALKKRGAEWLRAEAEPAGVFAWSVDLRYFGQNFELILDLKSERLDEAVLTRLIGAFHRRHREFYGYDMRAQPVEIVNLRLVVTAKRRTPPRESARLPKGKLAQALIGKRKVWFPDGGFVPTPVYDRERVPAGARLRGPAVIEQMDTTTIVPPRASLKNDAAGYLHIELDPPTGQRKRK